MNAVLQVLCDSLIFNLLPDDNTSTIVQAMHALHNDLRHDDQGHLIDVRAKMMLGREVGLDLNVVRQMCDSEFLSSVL